MPKPTKEQAIERLQKALDHIPSLRSRDGRSEEFIRWRRNTRVAVQNLFGGNANQVEEFSAIEYAWKWPDAYPQIDRQCYRQGLDAAAALLESMNDEIREYGLPNSQPASSTETDPRRQSMITQQVFVVHGRNQKARDAIFAFLRSIGLQPLEWNEAVLATGKASPYIGEILDAAFSQAGAVVVLMTPDDEARLRERFVSANDPPHETELTGQARPNVIFEAGMAMGRDADRTVLIELGSLRPFSDIGGRHVIRLDDRTQRRQELAQRLQSAGCPVNLDGTDWHTAGDFDAALSET